MLFVTLNLEWNFERNFLSSSSVFSTSFLLYLFNRQHRIMLDSNQSKLIATLIYAFMISDNLFSKIKSVTSIETISIALEVRSFKDKRKMFMNSFAKRRRTQSFTFTINIQSNTYTTSLSIEDIDLIIDSTLIEEHVVLQSNSQFLFVTIEFDSQAFFTKSIDQYFTIRNFLISTSLVADEVNRVKCNNCSTMYKVNEETRILFANLRNHNI